MGIASVDVTIRRCRTDECSMLPRFPTDVAEARVREGAPRGTTVIRLRAWNPAPACGRLRYEIAAGNQNEFAVHLVGDGAAELRTTRELDREIRAEYRLQVRAATDGRCVDTRAVKRRSAVASVIVTVSDVNDNVPFFPSYSQPIRIREGNQYFHRMAS
jgi:hypothetical protein